MRVRSSGLQGLGQPLRRFEHNHRSTRAQSALKAADAPQVQKMRHPILLGCRIFLFLPLRQITADDYPVNALLGCRIFLFLPLLSPLLRLKRQFSAPA